MSIIELEVQDFERQREMVKAYREHIENELKDICYELLRLLDKYLIPTVTKIESKVFYLKMKGDYYRYLTEITTGNKQQKFIEESKHAYKNGFDIAQDQMTVTHPMRLNLALNLSVFCYEFLNETDLACHLAKKAFDDAVSGLNCISGDSYKDSTIIMQLLRDNLKVWTKNQHDLNDMDQSREQQ
ncbi:unnamed protein product [Adineta steineri]|uniref:14-3-3 domain-containing protein n=1 Tax=Adineta steineri TaxID=433720 RepID=A0A814ICA2_9BILA|nr:unnamed protein product [Adineta steineri]CAF3881749.1 unnamed protein product [Adineta steineri]